MFFGGQARFGLLHFYPAIFQIISSFSTFDAKAYDSAIKYILLLGKMCQSCVFRLIFCLPDPVPHLKGVSQKGPPYWLGSH